MAGLVVAAVLAAACTAPPRAVPAPTRAPAPTTAPVVGAPGPTRVMAPSRVTAEQLWAWFESKRITGARPTVPVRELARLYIEEGAAEGVSGDVAFVQAIIETGWFRFSTRVPPELNNFSGMGAVDGGTTANRYPDARTGVRAQIQHLRAYGDPTVTTAELANPLVSTRWNLVRPKGLAPTWEQFGNGVWASDPGYAAKIQLLYGQLLAHAGVRR